MTAVKTPKLESLQHAVRTSRRLLRSGDHQSKVTVSQIERRVKMELAKEPEILTSLRANVKIFGELSHTFKTVHDVKCSFEKSSAFGRLYEVWKAKHFPADPHAAEAGSYKAIVESAQQEAAAKNLIGGLVLLGGSLLYEFGPAVAGSAVLFSLGVIASEALLSRLKIPEFPKMKQARALALFDKLDLMEFYRTPNIFINKYEETLNTILQESRAECANKISAIIDGQNYLEQFDQFNKERMPHFIENLRSLLNKSLGGSSNPDSIARLAPVFDKLNTEFVTELNRLIEGVDNRLIADANMNNGSVSLAENHVGTVSLASERDGQVSLPAQSDKGSSVLGSFI